MAPGTGERLGFLATATVGKAGWVDLAEPIIVRAGEAFIAGPEAVYSVSGGTRTPRSISPDDCCSASACLRQRSQMIRPSTSDECFAQTGLKHMSHSR